MGEKLPVWKRQRIIELVKADVELEHIVERLDVSKRTIADVAEKAGMPILQWQNRGYESMPIKVKRPKTGGRISRCAN